MINKEYKGDFMIKKIKFIATENNLIEVDLENQKVNIKFSDILPYWSYATESDFEGGFAKIFDDKILFSIVTASSQGGIIAIWNSKTQKIEHISDGAYCVAADLYDGKVYRLLSVSNFVTKEHFELWETPFGILDSNEEGNQIKTDLSSIDDKYDGSYSSVALKVSDKDFTVKMKEDKFSFPTK